MAEIASQITVWLVIAGLFGFAVGWLARGRGRSAAAPRRRRPSRFPR